jgi:hypothetical protein
MTILIRGLSRICDQMDRMQSICTNLGAAWVVPRLFSFDLFFTWAV